MPEHTVPDDALDRLFRAWRDDIDSEPFPLITDVVLPAQTRRRMPGTADISREGGTGERPVDLSRHGRTATGR